MIDPYEDIYNKIILDYKLEELDGDVPPTRSAQKERIKILTDQNNKLRFLIMGLIIGNNKTTEPENVYSYTEDGQHFYINGNPVSEKEFNKHGFWKNK